MQIRHEHYFTISFHFSPKSGTIRDKFRIRCSDWKNPDLPTTYEFRYDKGEKSSVGMSSTASPDYPILNPESLFQPELVDQLLPIGLKENDYKIKIIIRIQNMFGQFRELSGPDFTVQVCVSIKDYWYAEADLERLQNHRRRAEDY